SLDDETGAVEAPQMPTHDEDVQTEILNDSRLANARDGAAPFVAADIQVDEEAGAGMKRQHLLEPVGRNVVFPAQRRSRLDLQEQDIGEKTVRKAVDEKALRRQAVHPPPDAPRPRA